jgi:hypothetical protein
MKMIILIIIMMMVGIGCAYINLPIEGEYRYTHNLNEGGKIREIPIWIDIKFGEGDRIEIVKAIEDWNYAMNGKIELRIVDFEFNEEGEKVVSQIRKNGWIIRKIDSSSRFIPGVEKGFHTLGFVERVGGNHLYLIRDRLKNEEVFGVVLHEIGHLMGSGHVGDRLMAPHYSIAGNQCIDLITIMMVAKYNGTSINGLNYCYDTTMGDSKKN